MKHPVPQQVFQLALVEMGDLHGQPRETAVHADRQVHHVQFVGSVQL